MEVSKRLHSLDFLKFILAVIIILHHFQQITGIQFSRFNFYGGLISFGYVVECFFIISGFVTALGLELKPFVSFRKWMAGKCIRLYPMAVLSVVVTAIVYLLYRICLGNFPEGITIGLWQLLNSITLTFAGGGTGNIDLGINNPLWYLCVLLICYVFVYIVNWISLRMNFNVKYLYFALMIAGISAVTYKLNIPFFNLATGRGYSAFFLGMLFYYIYKNIPKKILITYSILCFVLCGICAVYKNGIDDQWGIFTFMIWPSVLIILLSCERFFSRESFHTLGAISFEMYLWHVPGLYAFIIFKSILKLNISSFLEMIFFTIIMIIISFGMLQIEKKITNLLKTKIVVE